MAELHIERKERSALPWVLGGLLLLALALWFLFGRGDDTTEGAAAGAVADSVAAASAPMSGEADAMPAAVTALAQFAGTRATGQADHTHQYTADGLRRLADALGAVTERATVSGVDVEPRLAEIRERADALQQDPTSTEHARQAREAFLLASGLMQQVQEARFSELAAEVREVNDAALAVEADQLLLPQLADVERFFERAAYALQAMVRAG